MRTMYRLLLLLALFCFFLVAPVMAAWEINMALGTTREVTDSLLNPENVLALSTEHYGTTQVIFGDQWLSSDLVFLFSFESWLAYSHTEHRLSNTITECYLSFMPWENIYLDLGKVYYQPGVGFFKNPSAFLLPAGAQINKIYYGGREKNEGRIILRGQYFSPTAVYELIYSPEFRWDRENEYLNCLGSQQDEEILLCSVAGHAAGFDLAGSVCYDRRLRFGGNLAYVVGNNLELHLELAVEQKDASQINKKNDLYRQLTGETAADLGILSQRLIPSFILGTHYTFPSQWNLMFEYYFNGLGFHSGEWAKIRERLIENNKFYKNPEKRPQVMTALSTAKSLIDVSGIPGMVRHYGLVRFAYDLSTETSLELIGLFNLIDLSGMSLIKCWYAWEPFQIGATFQMPFGEKDSEFGLLIDEWTAGVWFAVNF